MAARHAGAPSAFCTGISRPSETNTRSSHRAMRTEDDAFFSKRLRNERNTVDFLESGFARLDQRERGLAQRHGAGGARDFLQLARGGARDDELAQLVVHHQQLADRPAALEAGAAAIRATLAHAGLAERPHQPL